MVRRFAFLLLVVTNATFASPFTDWQKAFNGAQQPDREALLGVWAGHCAKSDAPDKAVAALYEYRAMGTDYDSQSHFLNQHVAPDAYLGWTLAQADADAAVSQWRHDETWPSIFVQSGSYMNVSDDKARAVRVKQGNVYLRYRRRSHVLTACEFTQRLVEAPVVPANFLADSGASEGGSIEVDSRDTQHAYRAVEVVNEGEEPVELTAIRVQTDSGWLLVGEKVSLPSQSSSVFFFSDKAEVVRHLSAFLSGKTKNLRFLGVK